MFVSFLVYLCFVLFLFYCVLRWVSRYQRDNQNSYIEEEQTTQSAKEKVWKDKQRSTKHTYETEDRITRTPLKTGGELRCYGRVGSSCSTSDITRRVNLVTNPVISHEWRKDREVLTTIEIGIASFRFSWEAPVWSLPHKTWKAKKYEL